jgi:hypothetical protein
MVFSKSKVSPRIYANTLRARCLREWVIEVGIWVGIDKKDLEALLPRGPYLYV